MKSLKLFLLLPLLTVICAVLNSGCLLFPESYQEVKSYDLLTPAPLAPLSGGEISTITFNNVSAVRQKMLYKNANGELQIDEFNVFIQPPDMMLNRYLNCLWSSQVPRSEPAKIKLMIKGTIFAMENDLSTCTVTLGVEYTITLFKQDDERIAFAPSRLLLRNTYETTTPEDYIKAFSACAGELGNVINLEAQNILNKNK